MKTLILDGIPRKMANHRAHPMIPLTDQDSEALDEIFKKVKVEEIRQIEETVTRYSVVPLEPWEETGWVVNSSLPIPSDPPFESSNL